MTYTLSPEDIGSTGMAAVFVLWERGYLVAVRALNPYMFRASATGDVLNNLGTGLRNDLRNDAIHNTAKDALLRLVFKLVPDVARERGLTEPGPTIGERVDAGESYEEISLARRSRLRMFDTLDANEKIRQR